MKFHIKLVQITWKKNTVKMRTCKGLRGRNEELQSEVCGVHKYLGLHKLVDQGIQKSFSSDVGKRMEIGFIMYQDFGEYNIVPQISLQLWPFPTKNYNHYYHTD